METILLVVHVLIAVFLIGVVLMQRSEGGALGIGGSGAGGGLMTGRGAANLLTRTTAILAAAFMTTSILLAIFNGAGSEPASLLDQPAGTSAPTEAPAPEKPAGPSAPLSNN